MRFWPDEPDRLVRVKTYFVPDDRAFVPWPHAFGDRIWEYQEHDSPPYGEQNGPRTWRGGQVPATAGSSGICGTPSQWLDGCKPDDPIPPSWPGTGVSRCCGRPALRFVGGTGTGVGPDAVLCAQLEDWPDELTVRLEEGLSTFGVPDGSEFLLTNASPSFRIWATEAILIGSTFVVFVFGCPIDPPFVVFGELFGGDPQAVCGREAPPATGTPDPPFATFEFPVDIPDVGTSPLTRWTVFA